MSTLAPVVVFAYRRPDHLRKTLTSLMCCEGFAESPIIVYCDGSRSTSDTAAVLSTRAVAKSMLGDRAKYHFAEQNLGLARSVIAGVGDTVATFGRAIVVEDDLELSPSFLTFMNRALDHYANEHRIFQISGYMFDGKNRPTSPTALFLPFTTSWGWATWKRAWDQFDPLAKGWEVLESNKSLRRRFNLDGAYDYTSMLVRQMAGKIDSWAIRWYWTVFQANGLVLFPPTTLVRNTGFDGSGTHGRGVLRKCRQTNPSLPPTDIHLPASIEVDAGLYADIKKVIQLENGGWLGKILQHSRRIILRLIT
jgi:hypothetical protein